MKLLDALKVGLEVLASLQYAGQVPLPVNWSWRIGKKRLKLKGEVTAEDA